MVEHVSSSKIKLGHEHLHRTFQLGAGMESNPLCFKPIYVELVQIGCRVVTKHYFVNSHSNIPEYPLYFPAFDLVPVLHLSLSLSPLLSSLLN